MFNKNTLKILQSFNEHITHSPEIIFNKNTLKIYIIEFNITARRKLFSKSKQGGDLFIQKNEKYDGI